MRVLQVYSCAYFIQKGLVQVTWAANARDMVNVLTIDDYFGELSLFVHKKLAYTARAVTHIDTFRLERSDFISIMRSHPTGAVHVADLMGEVLPPRLAKQVTKEIYDYSGLREMLAAFAPSNDGKWRPRRGLAEKLRRFAAENANTLARIRARSGRKSVDLAGGLPPTGGEGSPGSPGLPASGGVSSREIAALAEQHKRLAARVESGQARLEKKLDGIIAALSGGSKVRVTAEGIDDVLAATQL